MRDTTGAVVVAGAAAPRPPARRDHLQRGHQRVREGPKATTGAASVAGAAAARHLAQRDHLQRGHQRGSMVLALSYIYINIIA